MTGLAIESAAGALRAPFALETFYRLVRRLRARLDAVRSCLCRERSPPAAGDCDPLRQTLAHLHAVLPGTDTVAAFQLRFQRPFFG